MGMTRRRFLGCAAGAVTMGLRGPRGVPLDLWRLGRFPGGVQTSRRCVILELNEHCCLGESVSGYESAVSGAGVQLMRADAQWVPSSTCAVLIVPAALEIPPPAVRAIVSSLQAGASVILESGAGFAGGRDFRAHRVVLRDYLQVRIEAPVQLWSGRASSQGIPYVDYTWPRPAKVRDFSRVDLRRAWPGVVNIRYALRAGAPGPQLYRRLDADLQVIAQHDAVGAEIPTASEACA